MINAERGIHTFDNLLYEEHIDYDIRSFTRKAVEYIAMPLDQRSISVSIVLNFQCVLCTGNNNVMVLLIPSNGLFYA